MEYGLLRFQFYKPLNIRDLVFFTVKMHFMAIQFKRTIFASKETIKLGDMKIVMHNINTL